MILWKTARVCVAGQRNANVQQVCVTVDILSWGLSPHPGSFHHFLFLSELVLPSQIYQVSRVSSRYNVSLQPGKKGKECIGNRTLSVFINNGRNFKNLYFTLDYFSE